MEKSLKANVKGQSETNILGYEKIGKLLKMYVEQNRCAMAVVLL